MKIFNEKTYWKSRYKEHTGNVKFVGIKSFSIKANEKTYSLIKEQYNKLLRELGIFFKNKTILDAGAGIGKYTQFFLDKKGKITAIDITKNAINYVKTEFPSVNCLTSKLEDINKHFRPKQFYFVHCFDVLYHITNDKKWEKAVKNLALVSKKYVALHEHFSTRKPLICSKHLKWRSRENVVNELAKNNFYEIGSIPTTVVRRLFTYKILGFFPNLSYKLDKIFLQNHIAYKICDSSIKIFERKD